MSLYILVTTKRLMPMPQQGRKIDALTNYSPQG